MGFFCCVCKRGLPFTREAVIDKWDWSALREKYVNGTKTKNGWEWGVCEECAPLPRAYKARPTWRDYPRRSLKHIEEQYEEVLSGKLWERRT